VTPATSRDPQVLLDKGLMEQIKNDQVAPECLCGHPQEDHQGRDGCGAESECSVWDCECEFFAGDGAAQEAPLDSVGGGR